MVLVLICFKGAPIHTHHTRPLSSYFCIPFLFLTCPLRLLLQAQPSIYSSPTRFVTIASQELRKRVRLCQLDKSHSPLSWHWWKGRTEPTNGSKNVRTRPCPNDAIYFPFISCEDVEQKSRQLLLCVTSPCWTSLMQRNAAGHMALPNWKAVLVTIHADLRAVLRGRCPIVQRHNKSEMFYYRERFLVV